MNESISAYRYLEQLEQFDAGVLLSLPVLFGLLTLVALSAVAMGFIIRYHMEKYSLNNHVARRAQYIYAIISAGFVAAMAAILFFL